MDKLPSSVVIVIWVRRGRVHRRAIVHHYKVAGLPLRSHTPHTSRRFKAHSRLTVRVKRLWLYQRTVCQDRVTQTHLVLVDQRGVGGAIQSVGLQKRLFPSTFPMLIPSLSW
jgi:hypothetical protein